MSGPGAAFFRQDALTYTSLIMLVMKNIALLFLLAGSIFADAQPTPVLKKAEHHAMQYYLSLPTGWMKSKSWPILVVAEAAEKEFKKNAERFVAARKDLPFIIVAPIITTNGNQGLKDPSVYPYPTSTWDSIERMGNCSFDLEGIQQVVRDVQAQYGGSERFFMTGFEAGAHIVWAMTFKHPELLYAMATVGGNYRSRCMDDNVFSTNPARANLAIRNFTGAEDNDFGVRGKLYDQYLQAKKLALEHGYKNITEQVIKGKGHVPLPDEVVAYFYSLWN